MPEITAVVTAAMGLHARDAARFVRGVIQTNMPVTIRKPGLRHVDARSLLDVMTEDFHHGCPVILSIADDTLGDDEARLAADEALTALSQLLSAQPSVLS